MIQGDSTEYQLLAKWADKKYFEKLNTPIVSCEIGVREGMGTKIILDNLQPAQHIGVDPYGNLEYQHYDHTGAYTCDYTDDMYHQMQKDFAGYKNFTFFKLTDIEFMERYQTNRAQFHFVHFDGPHMTKDVLREAIWFADKSVVGTRFVFDDYPKYDMNLVAHVLLKWGFKQLEAGENKLCLEKVTS